MSWFLDVLGSAGFGSVVGGVFGYLSKREERENLAMKFNHDVEMIKAKTLASVEIAKINVEQSKLAGSLLVDKVEAEAFKHSQKTNNVFSEVLKSLIRPFILAILLYQSYMIFKSIDEMIGGVEALPSKELLSLYRVITLSVTSLTATAVGWYFAARTSKQFDKLVNKWGIE